MTKYAAVYVLFFSLAVIGCAGEEHSHAHFDTRPDTSDPEYQAEKNKPAASPAEAKANEEKARHDLALQQKVFDFMMPLRTAIDAHFTAPQFNDNESLEYFVGYRCQSLIARLEAAPKSQTNLLASLKENLGGRSLVELACDNSGSNKRLTVIPGKFIRRDYFDGHIIGEDENESLEISLRPDNTVSGYHIVLGPMDRNTTVEGYISGNAIVTRHSESEYHTILHGLNQYLEDITVDAADGSFSYSQHDLGRDEIGYGGSGTRKSLNVHYADGATMTADESVHVTPHISVVSDFERTNDTDASCTVDTADAGKTDHANLREQCFPEYRF